MANPIQLKRARLGGNDSAIKGRIGDIFEAFVFEPELKLLRSGESDGQGRESDSVGSRRSQDVEVELAVTDAKQRPGFPSPASHVAALRVALE